MRALEFKLDAFEGPLDLLLHLISKHKLNIYDIEISLLLEQYLEYIEGLEEQDFDTAGDFLAMAARLVYIKTCSLLPQPEEAEEMKKELQGELLDYSACKAMAERLRAKCVYGEVFVRPPEKLPVNKVFTGNIDPEMLISAYLGMNAKSRSMKPVKAEQFSPLVRSRFVTVTSKIIHVLKRLLKSGECSVDELYEGITDRSSRVATFLAVLELVKSGRLTLNDDNSLISFNRSASRKHPAKTEREEEQTGDGEETDIAAENAMEYEAGEAACEDDSAGAYDDAVDEPEKTEELSAPGAAKAEGSAANDPDKSRFRIALETISPRHSLAIPAFALFAQAPAENAAHEPAAQELDDESDEPDAQEEAAAFKDSCSPAVRIIENNRFAARCYWGYPCGRRNCWSYRRERV